MNPARVLCTAFLALASAAVSPALAADDPKDTSAHRAAVLNADGPGSDQDEKPGERGGPPNDDCSAAQVITYGGSVIFFNSGASTDPADPVFSCHIAGAQQGVKTVWFAFQAASPSGVLSLCNGRTFVDDTLLALYSGSCGALSEIACNDDARCWDDGESRLTFSWLAVGQTYYVQVASKSGSGGPMELTLTANTDLCSEAQLIPCDSAIVFNNSGYTTSPDDPFQPCVQQRFFTGWFTFVATGSYADVSLCNPGTRVNNTVLAVYSGSCGNLIEIACNDDAGGAECGPDGDRSRVTAIGLTPGETYFIETAGWDTSSRGQIELSITCGTPIDDCAFALPVTCGSSTIFDNSSFTNEPGDPAFTCYGSSGWQGAYTAWFRFVATGTAADISLCNPGTLVSDTILAVYSGSCGAFTELACNDDGGVPNCDPPGWKSRLIATGLTPGQTYFIKAAGWNSVQAGQIELTIDCSLDDCALAQPLSCDTSFTFNNTGMTTALDDPAFSCHVLSPRQGWYTAWFTFVASGTQADISLCNPGTLIPDTLLAVYTGACGAFTEIACNDDGLGSGCGPFGYQSRLTATGLIPGQTYYIQAASWSPSQQGQIQLTLDCPNPIVDCNANGIDDAADIQAGTSHDCFNASAAPNSAGGPNGVPDECECLPDWNRDGVTNSTDVSDFINTYFADQTSGGTDGDINCNGVTNSTDVSDFINTWFAAQAGQLPFAGCTI